MFENLYDNTSVRRQDRLLGIGRAENLLRTAEYGVLSTVCEDAIPYGVPLNFVWDGGKVIYIHCAPEGRKLAAIKHNATVSFCVVGSVKPLPEQFSTLYESVIVGGAASVGLPPEERRRALRLLVGKFAPEHAEQGEKAIEKSFHRTEIIRIDITSVSGKAKQAKT